jgi:hypothetical protein
LLGLAANSIGLAQGRFDRPTFFRDGQLQLDREIQRLQQEPDPSAPPSNGQEASSLLTVKDGSLSWQKYLFQDGGFSVWMPSGVQSQETIILETQLGALSFTVFATQPLNFRFIAAYSKPIANSTITPNQRLSAIAQGIADKTQFAIISNESLNDRPYPTRRLALQNQGETIIFEMYWLKNRIYVLAVGQQESKANNTAAPSFFDSFRPLP